MTKVTVQDVQDGIKLLQELVSSYLDIPVITISIDMHRSCNPRMNEKQLFILQDKLKQIEGDFEIVKIERENVDESFGYLRLNNNTAKYEITTYADLPDMVAAGLVSAPEQENEKADCEVTKTVPQAS